MPPRPTHDPFTDHNLRPTLRLHGSQQSLRSNASTASSRSRQPRDLFAPALSRRPNSRSTPRVEDEVFADTESDQENTITRQRQVRRVRHISPDAKQSRARSRKEVEPELEFVNRQADGGFLIQPPGLEEALAQHLVAPEKQEEDKVKEMDDHYAAVAREYFTSGAAMPTSRTSKKHEEEFEEYKMPMMSRLREQVQHKLDSERWRYEASGRYFRQGS